MQNIVFELDHPAARLVSISGGKGSALAKMTAAGLPVPQGFVIAIGAFETTGFSLSEHLSHQLIAADPDDLEALEIVCRKVRHVITSLGIPGDVASIVTKAYRNLGYDMPVSVRSSATVEDQPWASFAGLYDTFLNVIGDNELLARLAEVWASLYSTRAVAYRLRLGIDHHLTRMAVVVQRQLHPQSAGVLFTRHPVTGDKRRFLINATMGLGEGVVSAQIPSDSFVLDSKTLQIVSRSLGKKDVMLTNSPGGGIIQVDVMKQLQETPSLTDQQLLELGRLGHQAIHLFNAPQDIEFALDGDVMKLLQSRPVTGIEALKPFAVFWENPTDALHTWVRGHGPIFKLEEDAILVYCDNAKVCFEETGSVSARNAIVRFFNGYSYSRLLEMTEGTITDLQSKHRALDNSYRVLGTSLYEAEIRPNVELELARLTKFRPRRASMQNLVCHLEQALLSYGYIMGDRHWRMSGGLRFDWPSIYHDITGEPKVASSVLLQAIPNKTTRLVQRLHGLARLVQQDQILWSVFAERSYQMLGGPSVRNSPAVRHFRSRFRSLIHDYGLRTGNGFGSTVNFAAPTWNMDPSQPLDIIASYSKQNLNFLKEREVEARTGRHRAEARIRHLLSRDPERLERFNTELALAVEQMNRMENHNHIMEQGISGVLREAIYWTGCGLVREGLLNAPDDVLHLSMAELREIAEGGRLDDLMELVNERTQENKRHAQMWPPASLGDPDSAPENPRRGMLDLPTMIGVDGFFIHGVGASAGRARGKARVLLAEAEIPMVDQGDILVAPNAGPAWTPIFPLLGGLVLDEGSISQHAAIIAREYGIPAIINTRDATSVILDGQVVSLDADLGLVDLMP